MNGIGVFTTTFEVFVFGTDAILLGRYKTKIIPQFGDHLHEGFLFTASPNYIIHKRVLNSIYPSKINVFVFEVLKLYLQSTKITESLIAYL